MVVFLYGSMVWYVFPVKDGISWEGHLGGLISGLVFALIFRKQVAKPERYKWEQPDYNEEDDPFMKHFDENGNFIETLPEEEPEVDTNSEPTHINYIFKKREDS